MFLPNDTGSPARPPASASEASGTARGGGSDGLRRCWTALGEACRRTLGMPAAALAAIVAATIAAGPHNAERDADLAGAFMIEPTRNVLDMAVADLVWNDDRRAVTGLAGAIAAAGHQRFAARDRAALSTILADAGRRGTVSSGAIARLGAQQQLDPGNVAATSAPWVEVARPVAAFLSTRTGNERPVTEPVVWRDAERPVISMRSPLGRLRLAGYSPVHTHLVPALAGLDPVA